MASKNVVKSDSDVDRDRSSGTFPTTVRENIAQTFHFDLSPRSSPDLNLQHTRIRTIGIHIPNSLARTTRIARAGCVCAPLPLSPLYTTTSITTTSITTNFHPTSPNTRIYTDLLPTARLLRILNLELNSLCRSRGNPPPGLPQDP